MRPLRSYRRLVETAHVMESPVGAADETLARVATCLRETGIAFAVAGGFAVLAHGYERFTNDVDLLVGASDLPTAVRVLRAAGFRGGRTPLGARLHDARTGVRIDLLGTAFQGDERALRRSRRTGACLPVIPADHLVLMKLESGRSQDDSDVVGLLKAGVDAASVARYLRRTWPELPPRFRKLAAQARAERMARPRRRAPGSPRRV